MLLPPRLDMHLEGMNLVLFKYMKGQLIQEKLLPGQLLSTLPLLMGK